MILMVYGKNGMKEFTLPNTKDINLDLFLDRELFSLRKNRELHLENRDGRWTLHSGRDITIWKDHRAVKEVDLDSEVFFSLKMEDSVRLTAIVAAGEMQLVSLKKYDLRYMDEITIGRSAGNDIIYQFQDWVSSYHAILRKVPEGLYVEDMSTNGIFFHQKKIRGSRVLVPGDVVTIFGLCIIYLGDVLAAGSTYGTVCEGKSEMIVYSGQEEANSCFVGETETYVQRSPRQLPLIRQDEVEVEGVPEYRKTKEKPLLLTIGPSFTMALPMILGCVISMIASQKSGFGSTVFMYTGIVTAISSAVIGVFWGMAQMKHAEQEAENEEHERFLAYGDYLVEISDRLQRDYENNRRAIWQMYPPAQNCLEYRQDSPQLWGRNLSHDDFLYHRLGIGDIPFQVNIHIPKDRFYVFKDSLRDKPRMLQEKYKILREVPVGIDLCQMPLAGLVGGKNREGAVKLMQNLAVQIAANNCYTEVKMVFLYRKEGSKRDEEWECMKWFPHVWSQDRKLRYMAGEQSEYGDLFYELAGIFRQRSEGVAKGVRIKPHYVIFIEDSMILEGELLAKYVLKPRPEYGMSVFIMAETSQQLPNECELIIQNDSDVNGMFLAMDASSEVKKIRFDDVSAGEIETFARRLSSYRVREIESSSQIPAALDFFEMYGARSIGDFNILERWKMNRTYDSLRVPIGKKEGGSDCFLDVHEKYHGPHGLIAGTTGSGKSEVLQTYILSLAVNFSPDDVNFFVIDFKGGGMANLFSGLPHMAGQISNLSGNQIHRAMVSIKSENMRRQRIFSEYGVNNINSYTRLYKSGDASVPVPHLFLIIDEFAELKREEPDFMRELISVAQVGRSLGVHLLLATQKPSGTVDDNIWSNAKFRLCLRVQDRRDSNDMLHKPDAAFLTQAGRAYLQVGNDEIYEQFQSGYSGAVYDEKGEITSRTRVAMLTMTGSEAVVGNSSRLRAMEKKRSEWFEKLAAVAMRSLEELHLSMEEVRSQREELQKLTGAMYRKMEELGMDYLPSKTNTLYLENFLSLWPEKDLSVEETASFIRGASLLTGRKLPERREKTQLEALVEAIGRLAAENGYDRRTSLWMPVLKEHIFLKELLQTHTDVFMPETWRETKKIRPVEAVAGLIDDPVNQAQMPLSVHFTDYGHCAVTGVPVSGKSTFLQTVLYSLAISYNPSQLQFYIMDFGSRMLAPFEKYPHTGGIVFENDVDKVDKLFHLLRKLVVRRKEILSGGSYVQYMRSGKKPLEAIILVIDGYASFKEKTDQKYEEEMIRLSREAAGLGIYLLISSGGFGLHDISVRMADNIKNIFCLNMGDKIKYMEALKMGRIEVLPEPDIAGRGLACVQGACLEFQTALSLEAEDDFARSNLLVQEGEKMDRCWDGPRPAAIPVIPENPVLSQMMGKLDREEGAVSSRFLPLGYEMESAEIFGIDLSKTLSYVISGKKRTGKTNALKVLIHCAARMKGNICVMGAKGGELKKDAALVNGRYVETEEEMYDYWKLLLEEIKSRTARKKSLVEEGLDEQEIFARMQIYDPIFIFIDDLAEFLNMVYRPKDTKKVMNGFLENITEKGQLHHFYFIACLDTDDYANVAARKIFANMISDKQGVHLGGYLSSQRIFTFQNIPYQEAGKTVKKGIAYASNPEDGSQAVRVMIPLASK